MNFEGKLCLKIIFVNVYLIDNLFDKKFMYVIIDDQSSRIFVCLDFFNMFDIFIDFVIYILLLCSGFVIFSGRCVLNFIVELILEGSLVYLYLVIECDDIFNCREEIFILNIVCVYFYLVDLVIDLLELNENVEIFLLIGRDYLDVYYVLMQKIGFFGIFFV